MVGCCLSENRDVSLLSCPSSTLKSFFANFTFYLADVVNLNYCALTPKLMFLGHRIHIVELWRIILYVIPVGNKEERREN